MGTGLQLRRAGRDRYKLVPINVNPHFSSITLLSEAHQHCFNLKANRLLAPVSIKAGPRVEKVTTGATMASSLAFTLCIVLCICSLQTAVMAKKLNLVLYTHETRGGPNGTLLAAAGTGAGNFSALGWGSFLTVDNLLKEGPTTDSKTLGKFTGFAAITTKGGILDGGFLVFDQLRFGPASKYNGSTIDIIGTLSNPLGGPWELPVVAGTGAFRGYTGYVLSTAYLPTTVAPLFVFKWNFYLSK